MGRVAGKEWKISYVFISDIEVQDPNLEKGAVYKWRHPFFETFDPSLPLTSILLNRLME